MQPTQTETPHYNSRRERREAEVAAKIDPSLTRREMRAVERANVYLEGLQMMNARDLDNKKISPDAPLILDSDDAIIQNRLLSTYKSRVDERHWDTIHHLDKLWHVTQPTEEEAKEELATYVEDTPKERGIKLGQFISKRLFGARQNWLDRDTIRVKREHMQDMQHSQQNSQRHFKKAA